jgi:hypothetical protein
MMMMIGLKRSPNQLHYCVKLLTKIKVYFIFSYHKHISQNNKNETLNKIYFFKLPRASRLHLQSLAPTPFLRRVGVRWLVVKIIAESLSQHDEEHVLPTPLSGIL